MAQQYLFRFLVLIAVFASEVFSRPSNNEPTTPLTIDMEATEITDTGFKEERTLTYDNGAEYVGDGTNAKEIVNKIKEINNALKAPKRKPPVINNAPPYTGGGYVIDKDTLDKLQNIIASGMEPMPLTHKYQESNTLSNDDLGGPRKIRNIPYGLSNQFPVEGNQAQISSLAYLTSIPVLVMSTNNNGYSNDLNSITTNSIYQTRQSPSLPFPSPFASIFPILIRDPILSIMSGGGFSNFMQFGQSADVCNRKQKAVLGDNRQQDLTENQGEEQDDLSNNFKYSTPKSRQARALKKRTLSSTTPLENNIENLNKVKKLFTAKATTRKPIKQTYIEQEQPQDTKTVNADEGDLRFPFLGSDFTWFGNKKPVAPSPGFFINRLKVRRGGVAIAGPGGVATAGRGGTAIVGPGGLAYTQPGGLAVAGPAARVIALSSDTDLSSIVARLQEQTATDGSVPRLLEAIPEGKVVATGPVIFYHPNEQTYYRGAGWRGFQGDYRRENFGFSRRSDEYQYNGASIVKGPWMSKDSFVLHLKPVAHATNAPRGVAVANPVSNVLVSRNDYGSIIHTPTASAVVGPGGIAHAQSDLYLASIQYLPFYGGAKGQYLEIKRDNTGTVTSEKIISEEKISSENIFKNSNENLLSKVLAANLMSLKTTTTNLLRLQNIGRKTGTLSNNEKTRFKNQLSALGEAASNTIKLIDEIGDDIDMLFKNNATQRKYENDDYDYVVEEGVGIDSPTDNIPEIPLQGATIAEAKPVGLAVIGENGLAASRPVATAVASSGIALARPIATAIAGIDPAALGINFQLNHAKELKP